MTHLEKLTRYLHKQGVEVVRYRLYSDLKLACQNLELMVAPFTACLAIHWEAREIHYYPVDAVPWPLMLHEAGHILCSTDKPDDSEEIEFLGWELAVVKKLRLPMRHFQGSNREYGINHIAREGPTHGSDYYDTIGDFKLRSKDWRQFVAHYIGLAQQSGLVAADGTPTHHPEKRLR